MPRETEPDLFPELAAAQRAGRRAASVAKGAQNSPDLVEVLPLAGVDHALAYRVPRMLHWLAAAQFRRIWLGR